MTIYFIDFRTETLDLSITKVSCTRTFDFIMNFELSASIGDEFKGERYVLVCTKFISSEIYPKLQILAIYSFDIVASVGNWTCFLAR